MTEFPIHVYQSPGSYVSKGYRYKLTSAADQAELDALLADGWHMTLAKAVEAAGEAAKAMRPRADWRARKAHDAKVKAQAKRERLRWQPLLSGAKRCWPASLWLLRHRPRCLTTTRHRLVLN